MEGLETTPAVQQAATSRQVELHGLQQPEVLHARPQTYALMQNENANCGARPDTGGA